jgi:methionyl-tRNA formyltransferase
MKVVLMADGVVGLEIAQYLLKQYPSDLTLVITIEENAIYEILKKNGFDVLTFKSEEAILKKLKSKDVDLGILAWWPNILKSSLIKYPKQGFINTHPSFLPYNRGKHFSFWAIVEQAPFGVSIHCVTDDIDAGEIVTQREINYDWCDNGESLYYKSQEEMVNLFIDTYPSLRMGHLSKKPQDISKESYHLSCEIEEASKIDLDNLYTGRDLLNKLRARTFSKYPGCWFEEDNVCYNVTINIELIK